MIQEYLSAVVMGVVLGVLSTMIGYLKQKNLPKFSWLPLILRVPCGTCAAILLKYYGVTGTEAIAVGLALTELNDSSIKLLSRRFIGNKLDLLNTDIDKSVFHDLVVCTGDIEPGFDSYRGISAVKKVLEKYLDRLNVNDVSILKSVEDTLEIVKAHKELDTEVEGSVQRRLGSLVRVWFQYLKDNDQYHRATYADLSNTLYEDLRDLCGLKPS